MSEEKTQGKNYEEAADNPLWEAFIETYMNTKYIDDTGACNSGDLPETLMRGRFWENLIYPCVFAELTQKSEIEMLADCNLLAEILPRYSDKLFDAIARVTREAMNEYRAIKKHPCSLCKERAVSDRFHNICRDCKEQYGGEAQLVRIHLYRARRAGTPATLTLVEWIATLNRFNWKCAYCQENDYQLLEHYVPITKGGGTTAENCVPGCRKCNASKSNKHPEPGLSEAS